MSDNQPSPEAEKYNRDMRRYRDHSGPSALAPSAPPAPQGSLRCDGVVGPRLNIRQLAAAEAASARTLDHLAALGSPANDLYNKACVLWEDIHQRLQAEKAKRHNK